MAVKMERENAAFRRRNPRFQLVLALRPKYFAVWTPSHRHAGVPDGHHIVYQIWRLQLQYFLSRRHINTRTDRHTNTRTNRQTKPTAITAVSLVVALDTAGLSINVKWFLHKIRNVQSIFTRRTVVPAGVHAIGYSKENLKTHTEVPSLPSPPPAFPSLSPIPSFLYPLSLRSRAP